MNVGLRVDASAEIGTGHLARCVSLAHALRVAGAVPRFVVRDLGLNTAARLLSMNMEVVTLPAPRGASIRSDVPHSAWAGVSAADDAAETAQALAGFGPSWLVIDHYAFDAEWHHATSSALRCRIAAIDDLADRHLDVSLLIDHNLATSHRKKYGNFLGASVPILGGPRYALLAPIYANAQRCVVKDSVASIGVFMGGVDAGGFSSVALEALDLVGFCGAVEVVTTDSNPGVFALQDSVRRRVRTRLTLELPDLSHFFACHDVQIGASGGATWERCCIGAPTLAIVVANNQRRVLEPLAELGVLLPVNEVPPTAPAIARNLRLLIDNLDLRKRLSIAGRQLVDGHGAARVAAHLLSA